MLTLIKNKSVLRRAFAPVLAVAMLSSVVAFSPAPGRAQGGQAQLTRLLRYPDIHGDKVVFTYAGDLWQVSRSGGRAERLTSNPGNVFPKYSPDGRWIAFTGDYDGNTDIYVIPAGGGEPKRLTYHPAPDSCLGWTPDSKRVLFRSGRTSFSGRFDKLFTVGLEGGMAEELPVPAAGLTSYSPDGNKIAYNRVATESRTWKRYRGGWQQFISIYDLKANHYEEVPHTDAADMFPMWNGNSIYFDSDRDGVMNLYRYDLGSKEISQLTHYKDYDVKWPSLGGGDQPAIVYENGGYLFTLDLKTNKTAQVPVVVEGDNSLVRTRFVKVGDQIDSFGLSPSGARALFGARGDVFTVPAKKGEVRNLTESSGVRELFPTWSPDGKWIAYFSDRTGEYELYIRPQDGSGDEKRITMDGHALRFNPVWSPDSTRLLYSDKSLKLYVVSISDGKSTLVAESKVAPITQYDWAPDGKWISYSRFNENGFGQIFLYSVDQAKSFPVTDTMTNNTEPVFDKGGKYLYFLSNRNFTPSFSDFELDFNFSNSTGVYAVTLAADTVSPFGPESDEEKPAADAAKSGDAAAGADQKDAAKPDAAKADGKDAKKDEPKPVKVDLENIGRRVVNIPVPAGNYHNLIASKDHIFYLAAPPGPGGPGPTQVLHGYDIAKREDAPFLQGIAGYDVDYRGDKIIYSTGQVYGIIDVRPGQKVGDGALDVSGMDVKLDPRAEWKQIFNEAWRIERDFYYDGDMRGLDWAAIKARYEQELPFVAHRSDLNYLIGEMIAELSTSHAYVGGGDFPNKTHIGGGLLGADFEPAGGYYRFKKIYAGDNSSPQTRSPLTEPGVKVKEGNYLIAVNGRVVKTTDDPFAFFENTVGKQVSLKVNDKPSDTGAWTVTVRPIGSDTALRYLDWVSENRRKVSEATGGRCAYIHVPDTAIDGIVEFSKGFYAQTDKDAVIVDERWNSGGFVPAFFVERLNRQLLGYAAPRDGIDQPVPGSAIIGPKVMLVNEFAGSGGDAFPYFFRALHIGPIVGKRTWGGLVGINGGLPMVDGGFVTAPQIGFWSVVNGKSEWIVENKGVTPDVDVDSRPDLVVSGHDPQLEKAIEMINEQLQKNPPRRPSRPPYVPAARARQ